jgi:ribosomal protein L11 methyltransferase
MSKSKQINVSCNPDYREIIMAEFAAIGYESFQETKTGFITHSESEIEDDKLSEIIARYKEQSGVYYTIESVEKVNWNKEWEKSYAPILVDGKCLVRASFHPPQPEIPIEIIINPKMSFGTGHHETTYLMMAAQLMIDHKHKTVLDAGCGTGILSILAGKLGASNVLAYDLDSWVIDNVQENLFINKIDARVLLGTIQELALEDKFDIILANINKNILLTDIPYYVERLNNGGSLLMSGFYVEDLAEIEDLAMKYGLKKVNSSTKNSWVMAQFLAL